MTRWVVLVLVAAGTAAAAAAAVNPRAVPLGDGKVSTSPRIGYVDSCQTHFGGIGGAQAVGPWINTAAGTWDSTAKPSVAGSVNWPNAAWSVKAVGTRRVVSSNDLPNGHTSGTFPVASSDPASNYDRNPNSIAAQSIRGRNLLRATWRNPSKSRWLFPVVAPTP